MAQFNYSLAIDYFKSRSWAVLLSIIALIAAFILMKINILVCILLAVAGIWGIIWSFKGTKLEALKNEIEKIKSEIIQKAANELGVDTEQCKVIAPVVIDSFDYNTKFNNFMYNTSDNIPSVYRMVVILFSEEQVYYYDYTFSLISNEENISTGEYFYRDIVAFNTSNKSLEYEYGKGKEVKKYKKNYQEFVFATTGGTAFTCPTTSSEDNNKIQGMRQLLREKKNAMA